MRVAPGQAVTFAVYEQIKKRLQTLEKNGALFPFGSKYEE